MSEFFKAIAEFLFGHFSLMSERTYWLFLLSAGVMATLVHFKRAGTLAGLGGYLFPKRVWLHRSSLLDYRYFVANALVMALIFTPMIVGLHPAAAEVSLSLLDRAGAPHVLAAPAWAYWAYAIAAILLVDFLIFLGHWMQHKIPFLWQFHKVHHAAEVLNPMTLYRQHPMDLVMISAMAALGTGILQGVFAHLFSVRFELFTIGGLNLALLAFYLLGYNLRHSHIRVSFGRLDRWLISPEQHQLHHSCVEAHFDKNMGLILTVWDRLFGTHYVPAPDEEILLGLPDGESERFQSVISCWVHPIRLAFRHNRKSAMGVLAGTMAIAGVSAAATAEFDLPSVHLQDLTWAEVSAAQQAGYDRVIIPTGGTEQNGTHVILGKHNYVIEKTSEAIALELGDTLVAPVMAYTPESDFHMGYAGTLSLSEDTYERVLADAAESLLGHGFREILIIGDSGDSVAAQERVAERFADRGVRHIDAYYSANGQTDWLKAKGLSETAIGGHAGIRDTSETMAVRPQGVRTEKLKRMDLSEGANGSYWRATSEIGEIMLSLKIEAALDQIRSESD